MFFKEKSIEEIKKFLEDEICFDELVLDGGIYETKPIVRNVSEGYDITVGISYESCYEGSDNRYYYYNVFAEEEYMDIGGVDASDKERVSLEVISAIRDTISYLLCEDLC